MRKKITHFAFIFFLIGVPAEATFFGFIPPKCEVGDLYDPKEHNCYYCPRGAATVDKDCKGLPYLGRRCTHGEDHTYDPEQRRCVYCETGFVLLFEDNKCHPIGDVNNL